MAHIAWIADWTRGDPITACKVPQQGTHNRENPDLGTGSCEPVAAQLGVEDVKEEVRGRWTGMERGVLKKDMHCDSLGEWVSKKTDRQNAERRGTDKVRGRRSTKKHIQVLAGLAHWIQCWPVN